MVLKSQSEFGHAEQSLVQNQPRKQLKFIVNPFAGIGNKKNFQKLLKKYLDHQRFDYDVEYTNAPGHATEISARAVKEKFDIIVAVGGDGSVNEIASQLIGTDKILGIVPAGSGNGFATYLGYSRKLKNAILALNKAEVKRIDSCQVNDQTFFNVAGVGFDAWVAYKIKHSKFRGFWGYMWVALQETFGYKMKKYTITIDGKTIERKALCVEVANATMFGYNMQIAPLAKLDDGLLDLIVIKKTNKLRYLFSMFRFYAGNIQKSSLVEYYKAKEVEISCEDEEFPAHMDGEGFLSRRSLYFSVNKLSLSILKPLKKSKNE